MVTANTWAGAVAGEVRWRRIPAKMSLKNMG